MREKWDKNYTEDMEQKQHKKYNEMKTIGQK